MRFLWGLVLKEFELRDVLMLSFVDFGLIQLTLAILQNDSVNISICVYESQRHAYLTM